MVPAAQGPRQFPLSVKVEKLAGDARAILDLWVAGHLAQETGHRPLSEHAVSNDDRLIWIGNVDWRRESFQIEKQCLQTWNEYAGWGSKPFVGHSLLQ
jgi:hypothetical protein